MGRRKTREDYLEETALAGTDGEETDAGGEQPDVPFEALSDEARAEINDLFALLNRESYETVGGYQIATEGPDAPTVVTLSAILPSTNDWDPSVAYEDDDADDA